MADKGLKDTSLYEERFGFKSRNAWFAYCAVLLAVLLMILGLRLYVHFTFTGVRVDGDSMKNTLFNGEQYLMRAPTEKRPADYGDVIVIYVGDYEEVKERTSADFFIKRLIAKEGDKVYCENEQVYVQYGGVGDFVKLNEPYAYYCNTDKNSVYQFDVYEVGEGEVFFLGDNRENSCDSRYNSINGSFLKGRLYKESDIIGIVPDWAIKHGDVLEKIFF